SLLGGVQRTISLQPAIWAGTASIRMVENRGAVPPGIYSPTFWIGLFSCQHCTPSEVSTEIRGVFWAVWNFSIFAFACRIADFSSPETKVSAVSISLFQTRLSCRIAPSNFSVYLARTASPPFFTSKNIELTISSISATVCVGRFKIAGHSFFGGLYILFILILR